MVQWFNGSLVQWFNGSRDFHRGETIGSMVRWFKVQWFSGSMVHWNSIRRKTIGFMVQWFNGLPLHVSKQPPCFETHDIVFISHHIRLDRNTQHLTYRTYYITEYMLYKGNCTKCRGGVYPRTHTFSKGP